LILLGITPNGNRHGRQVVDIWGECSSFG
jgi:hypothetical protein